MNQLTLTLPKPHKAQLDIKKNLSRYNVIDCGRRFGKTTLGIDFTLPILEGYPVSWFSPTYKMMIEVWREINQVYHSIIKRRSQQEKRLEFITGGTLDMWSLDNFDAARGRKNYRVIIDEAAMVPRLQEAWQNSIRPTLTDYLGDAFFLSTPKGHNFFKALFDYGNDPSKKDWKSWQLPTSANPYIRKSEIEAARLELPERVFKQEYLAEFIDDAGIFRRVLDCATAVAQKPQLDKCYVFGVDWGKYEDFTVIVVLDIDTKEMVHISRFNQIDYNFQADRLKSLYEQYRPVRIQAESNAMGEPIIDQLRSQGLPIIPFTTTNQSKATIINSLSLAFEQNDIKIFNDPVLIAELQAFEATRLPSGLLRYAAPEGYHDDTVMALAMAFNAIPEPIMITANPFYG